MFLKPNIIIQGYSLPTIYIFLFFGVISWFFVMWYEGRRDGFDTERFFDLSFLTFLISLGVFMGLKWQLNWLSIYKPMSFLLNYDRWLMLFLSTFAVPIPVILLLCKKWRWSKYRVLDIYVTAITQLGFFLALGTFFIYESFFVMPFIFLLPGLYFLFLRSRGHKFDSGVIFSIFLFFLIPYILIFYRRSGYLIFLSMIATISSINLFLRKRKKNAKHLFNRRIHSNSKTKTS